MRQKIKKYELNKNTTIEQLKNAGFSQSKGLRNTPLQKYCYIKYLVEEVELYIEIEINNDNTLKFDDFDNVLVLDDDFCQPYQPFYNEIFDCMLANNVIEKYNEAMDELVKKGILQEKQNISETVKDKKYIK